MNVNEMQNSIKTIMSGKYGLKVFALLKNENGPFLKKFIINDDLDNEIREMVLNPVINRQYLSEDVELDSSDNIADNKRILYEVEQDDTYCPFEFLSDTNSVLDQYEEKDQDLLMGLVFRVNLNDDYICFYQHIYQVRVVKRKKSVFAMLEKEHQYAPLDKDIFKIDTRIDILIIDNSLISSNINLLQNSFAFDKYIRKEAERTIEVIEKLDIVSDISKFFAYEDKQKLTNAKKLLKAKNSPVLKMKREELVAGLKRHHRYKDMFEFVEDQIVITSQKNVNELVKMLNDDIVRSELTNQEYDSSSKQLLS